MAALARILVVFLVLAVVFDASDAAGTVRTLEPSLPDAISDLKKMVVTVFEQSKMAGFEISEFDVRDASVGQSMLYDFHVEVEDKLFPIRLLGDVNWSEMVDVFKGAGEGKELMETERKRDSVYYPVLPSFQLAGPLELWIQDGDDMRLSLPHDVDAGVLKKVILADGAVVTIKGARSISLRHPIELPLPLNRSNHGREEVASGLLALAEALRDASRINDKPLVSLRIVGPTSLASSSSTSPTNKLRLKLKRLAPGLVELSSPLVPVIAENQDSQESEFSTLWPLTSLNSSDMSIRGFEKLLASILDEKANQEGSFRLVKADVHAKTFLKLSFQMSKSLLGDEGVNWSSFPEWRTRPEKTAFNFEVLARLEENGKVSLERITGVEPLEIQDSIPPSVMMGNFTMSKMPTYQPPPSVFTV